MKSLIKSLGIIFLLLSFLSRLVLTIYAYLESQIDLNLSTIFDIFGIGFVNDLMTFAIIILPIMVITYIISFFKINNLFSKKINYIFHFIVILSLVFNIFSEFFFWEEFSTRFNFIAVDYLIYTNEVFANIAESYPLKILIASVILISIIIFRISFYYIKSVNLLDNSLKIKTTYLFAIILIAGFDFYLYSPNLLKITNNRYLNELNENGIYNLFSAYRNNTLDYDKFYSSLPNEEAFSNLKKQILQKNQSFTGSDFWNIERKVTYSGQPKKYNIILIVVESLSYEFLGALKDGKYITPNLNKLKKESLFFDRLYATGTRTVRGLESLTLSVPPTPGSSIVRRPNNENLFNISTILAQNNYESTFLYGGFGYFDNMNYFFANNGYNVIDRNNFKNEEINFANAWGVADGDLFAKALQEADGVSENLQKPFFQFIMTTSNHRPFTFPDGKIDLPSGQGREAAVKYTDYAIGKFLEDAKKKTWFKDSIFIITADHCHSSAGKTDIPINKYHIPMFVYSPSNIEPGINTKWMSQMDVAPTILGLLNISYNSKFFGNDIMSKDNNIFVMGTYQLLGYYNNKNFAILAPKYQNQIYKIDTSNMNYQNKIENSDILNQAISYYQTAFYLFKNGLMKNK